MVHMPGHSSKKSAAAAGDSETSSLEENQASALPPAQQATWTSFIKSLANVSGDLSSMTAPPFILSPVSLTEFPAYWCERPDMFAAIGDGKTPEERASLVLRWFICTLKGQYTSRNEKMGSEKKPLNPVLGEVFFGTWPNLNDRGETILVVEQVSHHPPITSYFIENKTKGVALQGASGQKTSFSFPSIIVKQNGHAILTITLADGSKEEFLITLPRLRIDGLITGSPYMEITEGSHIHASTGYNASISYSGRGYISGKAHTFKAHMVDGSGRNVFTVEGQWDKTSKLKTGELFSDSTTQKEEVTVASLEAQGEWESRRLWKEAADGIKTGDFDRASREKTKIEVEQREQRKTEVNEGLTWDPIHFKHVDSDPIYKKLASQFKHSPAEEEGWVFLGGPEIRPARPFFQSSSPSTGTSTPSTY
ncbi:Oxysterol-binding protein [Mrakia frigida]|uniref:OSBP family protein n=1 Tax=Mrakia frigida TaxID=29902 RepID=UPI003FCC07EF